MKNITDRIREFVALEDQTISAAENTCFYHLLEFLVQANPLDTTEHVSHSSTITNNRGLGYSIITYLFYLI